MSLRPTDDIQDWEQRSHLDSLLHVPELNAIQWVPGAGRGGPADWVWLYQ